MAKDPRRVEIRAGLAKAGHQGGLDFLTDQLIGKGGKGESIRASYIRDGIDNLGLAKNVLHLDGIWHKRYKEFKAAYEKWQKNNDGGKFKFGKNEDAEANLYTDEQASKIINTVEGKGAAKERFKYGELGRTDYPLMGKLFADLPKIHQMGHRDISILITQMSLFLVKLPPDDPRRSAIKAMIVVAKKIDSLTDEPNMSLEELIGLEKAVLSSDMNVKAEAEAVVNAMTGIKGEVNFTMEITEVNQLKSKKLGQRLAKSFQKVVRGDMKSFEALFKGIDITNLRGSPSIAQHIGAQVMDILDPAVMGRPGKVKIKPKPSKQKAAGLKGGKKKKLKTATLTTIALTKPKKPNVKSSKVSLNNMLGMINSKLPGQVLDNMGAPRLESRTGRFAQSVKVTEVIKTPKGFPSIGYTYSKDPYQVYETTSGTRFSDSDRDPRTLIDASIREIAATMAIGRLYTRRV